MAKFFINRPIFAIVIAIIIMLAGALSIFTLPVEQYPPIAPPSVQIATSYPGASAVTVNDVVVQVIEQQMSGIDNLIYMSSVSDDSGQSTTTLTFAPGTNPDIAQVQVQNKLQLAVPLLPQQVQQTGVRVTKSTNAFLMFVGFISTDNSMSKFDIANYVVSHVQDPHQPRERSRRISTCWGTQYAMRVWLDLDKLNAYALTPIDVSNALLAQNVQISGGQLGGTPAVPNQQLNATITEATLLRTPGAVRRDPPEGAARRLAGAACATSPASRSARRTSASTTSTTARPHPASASSSRPAPTRSQTAQAVRAKLDAAEALLPSRDLQVVYPNDTTPFIRISIQEVVKTLLEGIVLVVLVMYLFLQNWRATLIPAIAVPVVLLGTFGLMAARGLHHQHPLDVRPGAGDRPPRRRRHRRGGERRARHDRGEARPEGSDREGDGPDHRGADRRGDGALRGLRAGGHVQRHGGRDLPPVLAHDRRGDAAVGVRGAHAHAGALRDAPQGAGSASTPCATGSSAGSTAASTADATTT